jgi:hypothetical protein
MSEDHWQVALRHAPPGEVPSLRFPEGSATKAPVAEHTQPPPSSVHSEPHRSHSSFEHRGRGHRSGAGSHRGDRGASDVRSLALPQQQSRWVLVDDVITSQEVSQAAHRQRLSELTVRINPPPFPRSGSTSQSPGKGTSCRLRWWGKWSGSDSRQLAQLPTGARCDLANQSSKAPLAVDA